jgi:membrane protease YdiL (CAAX protease family)
MPTDKRLTAAFAILAALFCLNDFALIALNGGYGVYLADCGTRVLALSLILLWPVTRAVATERLRAQSGFGLALLCAASLPLLGRPAARILEPSVIWLTGIRGWFDFHALADPGLYWLDLTFGLFAVAVSEELIFRKLAMKLLERSGQTPAQIIVTSALVFALVHWGSGPGRMLYVFVIGMVYMAVYVHLKRLWPLVFAHWAENFLAFGPLRL